MNKPEKPLESSNLSKVINFLQKYEREALIAVPASDAAFDECRKSCDELDWLYGLELPNEYVQFLKLCNGYAYKKIELYGTQPQMFFKTDFLLKSIAEATAEFSGIVKTYPMFCFGSNYRYRKFYFTYDPISYTYKKYAENGELFNEYDTFEKFFMKEVVDFSGINMRKIDKHENPLKYAYSWSKLEAGGWIFFIVDMDDRYLAGFGDVYKVRPDGTELTLLWPGMCDSLKIKDNELHFTEYLDNDCYEGYTIEYKERSCSIPLDTPDFETYISERRKNNE